MSGIDVTWVAPEDFPTYFPVYEQVYLRGDAMPESSQQLREGERCAIARIEGDVVGGFLVEDYRITCRGGVLRCAGIAAVAVMPTVRRQGVGHAMMNWALAALRAEGYDIASLYGFSHRYYREFGYETAGIRWELKVPTHRLPKVESSLPVRRVREDELDLLNGCYETFARQRSGVNLRTSAQWKERLGAKPPMIFAVGEPVRGYLWTKMEGGFHEEFRIGELVWSDRESYLALLDVISGLAVNRSQAVWYEPSPSPFLGDFDEQGVVASRERPTMYRILNLSSSLDKANLPGGWALEVTDDLMNCNTGLHVVGEGNPEVAFRCDHRAFVQALLGEPSLRTLAEFGRVEVLDSNGFEKACADLPRASVICTEFF